MANCVQEGILINIRALDFPDKKTGEVVKALKLTLARPVTNPQYEGFGYVLFDLVHYGEVGLKKYGDFMIQAKDLILESVKVDCDLIPNGKSLKLIPLSISPG